MSKLETALENMNINVLLRKGSVEVMPQGLHSGVGLRYALEDYMTRVGATPDLFLVIGDDSADEYMYNSLYEFMSSQPKRDAKIITATVSNSND